MAAKRYVYDAKKEWTNSLFLDFADSELTQEMAKWRTQHGLSDFPCHATLLVVDPQQFPPDDPKTPANVAAGVREVLAEFFADKDTKELPMHVDGLIKFGDYKPHKMRMLQVEAVGNFVGADYDACKQVDGGDGLRKLYAPCEKSTYSKRDLSPDAKQDYDDLQRLREKLCMKFGSEDVKKNCADHTKWKPHVSAGYVNEGCEDGMSEAMVKEWQQAMLDSAVFPCKLKAMSVSYWYMKGKIASQWVEQSKVTIPDLEVDVKKLECSTCSLL